MKYIFNLLCTIILLVFATRSSSQVELGKGTGITIKGTSIGNQVVLKWVPDSPEIFQSGRSNGYKIVRYTLTNSSSEYLSDNVSNATVQTIALSVKPISISRWDSITNGTHPFDSLMRFGYLSTSFDFQPSGTKIADAIDYREKKKNAYIYAALIADSDIKMAQYLGLAYTDNTAAPGLKYKYYVTVNNTNVSGGAIVEPMNIGTLSSPTNLTAIPSDKKITLSWSSEGLDQFYTYYDIYRSDNGGATFIKANSDPFIYMGSGKDGDELISFGDKVPSNGVSYTYKIRGISPYGLDGPFSETISAIAIPSRMNLEVHMSNVKFSVDSAALITWSLKSDVSFDPTPFIDRIDILYRKQLTDTAEVLNLTAIPGSALSFNFDGPAPDGFYFVRATDLYDYEYTSIPFLGQRKDSIPPGIPTGLIGSITPDGRVKLNWNANVDNDLLGYKLYMAYGTKNPFTQITSTHIVGTEYRTEIKSDNANDTIFYRISAVDERYNISQFSASVFVLIPDRNPPSEPVLKRITATKDGMRVAWSLSQSRDLSKHLFQRKFKTAIAWTDLLTIPSGDPKYQPLPLLQGEFEPANFIDIDSLELRVYDYRLMAIDSSNNKSISQVISIKPFDDGKRGNIRPFDARLVPLGAIYNPTPQPPLSDNPNVIQTFFPDITDLDDPNATKNLDPNGPPVKAPQKRAKTNIVRLEWEYTTEFPSSVVAFQIYQKKASSTPGNISQALPLNPPFVLVRTVSVRDAQLIANMNNLSTNVVFIEDIPGRKEVTTPAEYKIIAKHKDGGFSLPALDSVIIPPITF